MGHVAWTHCQEDFQYKRSTCHGSIVTFNTRDPQDMDLSSPFYLFEPVIKSNQALIPIFGKSRGYILERFTPMGHKQPYKWTWHHTLTQNLKAHVYGSFLTYMVLNLLIPTLCGTSSHTCIPIINVKAQSNPSPILPKGTYAPSTSAIQSKPTEEEPLNTAHTSSGATTIVQ